MKEMKNIELLDFLNQVPTIDADIILMMGGHRGPLAHIITENNRNIKYVIYWSISENAPVVEQWVKYPMFDNFEIEEEYVLTMSPNRWGIMY